MEKLVISAPEESTAPVGLQNPSTVFLGDTATGQALPTAPSVSQDSIALREPQITPLSPVNPDIFAPKVCLVL